MGRILTGGWCAACQQPPHGVRGSSCAPGRSVFPCSAAAGGGAYSPACPPMPTTAHLDNLNAAQRKAATHGEALPDSGYRAGPLLIVAGAGTGKTDTLAHRVAHLVIHGVDPARILMLTFTRRAAVEMRRRAHEITRRALNEPLGGLSQSISQRLAWAGTF